MARKLALLFTLALALVLFSRPASAQTLFNAFLSGTQEAPPNASPASGFGTALLNLAETQITVDLSFSGLLGLATAAHIHGPAPAGTNAPVLFPLTGVPAATSGTIPEQSFAITPTQVVSLKAGLFYMNVHSNVFPGGEIRGQLLAAVPEPGTLALAAGCLIPGMVLALRRRR